MAIATIDTQQGFTLTLSVDSATLKLTNAGPIRKVLTPIRTTNLATTGDHEWLAGELADYPPIPIVYQNSPGVANPTNVVQTGTFTMPLAPGGAVAESVTGTGFITEQDILPGVSSESEGLQMKSFMWKWDGLTGPTRTIGS